jgi:tetratricopeptide (TPR) repeat protein
MPTFGPYETLSDEPVAERRERGHSTTVWRARREDAADGRVYAIKVFTPKHRESAQGTDTEELDGDPCLAFIEGVKRLGKAQQEGGRCLAKVLDMGRVDGGVWVAGEYRERGSLEDFIARKLSPGTTGLRHVVASVVTGCLSLKRSSGWPHGGLKPSNVLLASEGPALLKTAIELTDAYPASLTVINRLGVEDRHDVEEMLAQAIELQDLRCIGELILQLVEQRPVRNAYDYNYPIQISPAWTGLGREGEWWLALCNRLLDPHLSPEVLSLESLAHEVQPPRSRMPLPSPKVLVGAGVAALVLLVLSGSVLMVKKFKAGSALKAQQDYQVATNAAGIALLASDHAEAIQQAQTALRIKPSDPAATALLDKARAEQAARETRQREERYQAAASAAQSALVQRNYTEVIRQADLALDLRPGDAVAERLKAQARQALSELTQAERDYQTATNAAVAALRQRDFTDAIRQADAALAVRPNDPVATQLKSDAEGGQREAAQAEEAYQAATNAAGVALRNRNLGEAIRQADLALGLKPGDLPATRLKTTAEQEREALATAEQNYQSATNAAAAALRAGDYAEAIRQADLALAVKSGDSVASTLGKQAQDGLATLARAEREYQTATNAAGAALRERDFPETIRQADIALKLKPDDSTATRLKADATAGAAAAARVEQDYQSATNRAGLALRQGNLSEAIREADVALELKPGDAAASRLKADANAQALATTRLEEDYQSATNRAGQALAGNRFEEAIREAVVALKLKPGDPVASKLQADAKAGATAMARVEQEYRSATNAAGVALRGMRYTDAIKQADVALGFRPGDAVATRIKEDAQQAQAAALKVEGDYQAATNAAATALRQGNFREAIQQANAALALKAGDTAAQGIRQQAQASLDYQAAMTAAQAAMQQRDYASALVRAGDALRIRTGDAAATKLRDEAQAELTRADSEAAYASAMAAGRAALEAGNLSQAVSQADLALTRKPDDAAAAELKRTAGERLERFRALDNELQVYQVMFGLARPRDDLRYQDGKRVEPLPTRQIAQSFLDTYSKRVNSLEQGFAQAGSLDAQRQEALRALIVRIRDWNNRY